MVETGGAMMIPQNAWGRRQLLWGVEGLDPRGPESIPGVVEISDPINIFYINTYLSIS